MELRDFVILGVLALVLLTLLLAWRQERTARLLQAQLQQLTQDCVRIANTELQENREGRRSLINHLDHGLARLEQKASAEALAGTILTECLIELPRNSFRGMEGTSGIDVILPFEGSVHPPCVVNIAPVLLHVEWTRLLRAADTTDRTLREGVEDALVDRLWKDAMAMSDAARDQTSSLASILFVPTQAMYKHIVQVPKLCEELYRDHAVVVAGPQSLVPLLNALDQALRTGGLPEAGEGVKPFLRAIAGGRR